MSAVRIFQIERSPSAMHNIDASLAAKSNASKIDVANLSAGVYIARIVTASGSKNIKFYLSK